MEVKPPNSWHNKTEVQKGDLGERIVDAHLVSKGMIPYRPDYDGPHPFDRLCATHTCLMIAEAKTKARRTCYPDTGINVAHYNKYKAIQEQHKINVFVYFVDEGLRQIYGNILSFLEQPTTITVRNRPIAYPWRQDTIIYFPTKNMEIIANLSDEQVAELRRLSTRNPNYKYKGKQT